MNISTEPEDDIDDAEGMRELVDSAELPSVEDVQARIGVGDIADTGYLPPGGAGPEYKPGALDSSSSQTQVAADMPSLRLDSQKRMAPPIAATKPPVDSLDWKQLADRLSAAEMGRDQSRAYESMFANIGAQSGYRPNPHAGEGALNVAKQPLELAQAKQGMEARDLSMQAQRANMGAKAAERDPNSLQSQKARDSVKAFYGDVPLPPGFGNWSAADVKEFASSGALARVQQAKDRDQAAAAKAFAGRERAAAETQALENSRKAYGPELKRLGIDPTHASQKDIDRAIELGKAHASQAIASSNNAIARANEGRKVGEHEALNEPVPFAGATLKYTGAGTPREEDVRETQKISGLYGSAIRGMNDLEEAMATFAQHPSTATRGDVIAKARVVAGHLNTAAGQGAMSKDEAEEMAKALGISLTSPGSLAAMWEKVTGNDAQAAADMTRRLRAVRESARRAAMGKIEPYHFAPEKAAGGGPVAPPAEEESRVINGKTYRKKNGKWVTDA